MGNDDRCAYPAAVSNEVFASFIEMYATKAERFGSNAVQGAG